MDYPLRTYSIEHVNFGTGPGTGAWSFMWYCPLCGECWARAVLWRNPRQTAPYHAIGGVCRDCGKARSVPDRFISAQCANWVPGSVWRTQDPKYLASLPRQVLEWEFERHLEVLTNEQ